MNVYPLNDADVAGLREVRGDGDASLAMTASGAVMVGKTLAGEANAAFDGSLNMRIGQRLAGTAPLIGSGALNLRIGVRLAAEAPLVLGSSLELARGLRSDGEARLVMDAAAAAYTAGVTRLGARARFLLHARGALIARRYVYLGGTASLSLAATHRPYGRPAPAAVFVAAPRQRQFSVPPDNRTFRVPRDEDV